jgi:hypothetical protein
MPEFLLVFALSLSLFYKSEWPSRSVQIIASIAGGILVGDPYRLPSQAAQLVYQTQLDLIALRIQSQW